MNQQKSGIKPRQFGRGEKIPEWAQYTIAFGVVAIIFFLALRPAQLKPSEKMKRILDQAQHGTVQSRSRAIWELPGNKPTEAAAATSVLIGMLGDETTVDDAVAREFHESQEKLAGQFADFYQGKAITIGDLAAWALRRIRQNLVIECVGDGPTNVLVAVRKTFLSQMVPQLCSANQSVRYRILDVLSGDTDSRTIPTIMNCGLNDSDFKIRRHSAALFITHGHSSPKQSLVAVPKLIEFLGDNDDVLRSISHAALKAISGLDFGQDQNRWRGWFAEVNK